MKRSAPTSLQKDDVVAQLENERTGTPSPGVGSPAYDMPVVTDTDFPRKILRIRRSEGPPPAEVESLGKTEENECDQTLNDDSCGAASVEKPDGEDTSEKDDKVSSDGVFTNPFAEVAKLGNAGFLTSGDNSLFSSSKNSFFSAPSAMMTASPAVNGDDDEEVQVSSSRPVSFSGEEDEKELFSVSNAVLFKSVPVIQEGNKTEEEKEKPGDPTTAETVSAKMRYRRQGEGVFKLLTPKDEGGEGKPRLVMRQKGTWRILLNSLLAATPRFDVVDHMSNGFGLKFIGLDNEQQHGKEMVDAENRESSSKPTFSAYCIKFPSDISRKSFLDATALLM